MTVFAGGADDWTALASINDPLPQAMRFTGDRLSATAVAANAAPLLAALLRAVAARGRELRPVALPRLMLMLIGKRPGLSSPDSLGACLTYAPRPGLTDERRNCVSNIRPAGLPYDAETHKLLFLIEESLPRGLSGVALKDQTDTLAPAGALPPAP